MRPFHPSTWPIAVWVFAPLALGVLYALGHAALVPAPTLTNLPPADAILVQRFRNLQALDRASFGPRGAEVRAPRELIAAARNVRGLPGVDPSGPIHLILMPRTTLPDSSIAVFPLEDAAAFEAEFQRSDFIERDLVRHAQHLVRRGPWAAIAPNRDDARRLGTGGITAADLGEDQALAAVIPRLVDHALSLARQYPWRSILRTLGVAVDALYTRIDPDSGVALPVLAGDERMEIIRSTWAEGRLWTWFEAGRTRVELTPQRGSVAEALRAVFDSHKDMDADAAEAPPFAPSNAEIEVRIGGHGAAGLTAQVLRACGVPFLAPGSADAATDPLGGLGRAGTGPAGLLLWAEPAQGSAHALTIGLASRQLPDLGAFLPLPKDGQAQVPLPAAQAVLTIGSSEGGLSAPRGAVARSGTRDGLQILVFGVGARGVLEAMQSHIAAGLKAPAARGGGPPPEEAFRVFARFRIDGRRAGLLLGRSLRPGGFLAALAPGDIHGTLSTDGAILRLEAWLAR